MSENLSLVDNRPSNDRIRVDYVLWFVVFFYLCLIGLEISSIWYGTVGYFFFILNSIPFLAVGRIICGIIWMRRSGWRTGMSMILAPIVAITGMVGLNTIGSTPAWVRFVLLSPYYLTKTKGVDRVEFRWEFVEGGLGGPN